MASSRPSLHVLIAAPRGFCAGVDRAIQIVELALERFGAPVYVRHILFIGHAGHPEVIGTFGQVPAGCMTLVETLEDAESVEVADPHNLAFLTQTTLSVDDTAAIVESLTRRFPTIRAPRSEDICYATSNRQAAVKAIAQNCEKMLVIGAPNSSNSLRLAEVAERMGVPARLIERAENIDWEWLGKPATLGLTAGASAPELLVREVVDALRERFEVTQEEADHSPERMIFKLPRELVA